MRRADKNSLKGGRVEARRVDEIKATGEQCMACLNYTNALHVLCGLESEDGADHKGLEGGPGRGEET